MQGELHEPLSTRKSLETEAQKRSGCMGVSLVRRDQREAHVQETQSRHSDLPSRRDAEQAVADFRANINVEVRVPIPVSDLIAHYRKHELTGDKKAFATIESTSIYLTNHIAPKWGEKWLSDVRTVEVEEWLHALSYAPATKSKIRNIMSAVFNHAIRHEWTHRNPITRSGLRRSACGSQMY
jgi:hypothetical protein